MLGRLLSVGSEWASYATLVPTGGARKAARAAADEASEQLGRQDARQAARKADDEWRSLYRSVSLEELDDIEKSGQLRIKFGQMEGKWFTITPGLAARWGKRFYKESPFAIIEVAVPKRVLRQMYYDDKLDGIGPAYYAEQHLLPHIRYIRKLDYIP